MNRMTAMYNHSYRNGKQIPGKYLVHLFMLYSGVHGFTGSEIVRNCHLSSGSNYINKTERASDIHFNRKREKTPDGHEHFRYSFASPCDVIRLISMVNDNAARNRHEGITASEISDIVRRYPPYNKAVSNGHL